MIVDCGVYREGHRVEGPQDFSDALDEARSAGGFVWIGLHEPTAEEFDLVAREFALHPLAVEDALKAHQRPKLEVYDDSVFVVLKPVVYEPSGDTVSSGEIMLFLGDSFAVSVRHGEGRPLDAVRDRLEREPELLGEGATAVLYAVADAVVDHYLEVATELQTDLEELEAEVFTPRRGRFAPYRVPDLRLQAADPGVPPGHRAAGGAAGPAGGGRHVRGAGAVRGGRVPAVLP